MKLRSGLVSSVVLMLGACGAATTKGPKDPIDANLAEDTGRAGAGGGGGAAGMGGSMAGQDGGADTTQPDRPADMARDLAADRSADLPPDTSGSLDASPSPPVSPWLDADIGAVGIAGNITTTTNTFSIQAGGAGVEALDDSFYFVYQRLTGDGEIVGRVRGIQGGQPLGKAGVMMRVSTETSSRNVFLAALGNPALGGWFQYRVNAGGTTSSLAADPNVKTGIWLRIQRRGNTFVSARSNNRVTWTEVGRVDLPGSAAGMLVGLAVESHSTTTPMGADFDGARINNLDASASTTAWISDDVNTIGGGTISSGAGATYTLAGMGDGLTSTTGESFGYLFQAVTGSQSIAARIADVSDKVSRAYVGLMFRDGTASSLSRMVAYAGITVAGDGTLQFHRRETAGAARTLGAQIMGITLPIWLRLDRVDTGITNDYIAYYSATGTTWTRLDTATFALANPAVGGVAVTSGTRTSINIATVTDLTLQAGTPSVDGGPPDAAADAGAADASGDGG